MQTLEAAQAPYDPIQLPRFTFRASWTIPLTVISLHLIALFCLTLQSDRIVPKKSSKKLIVHTVTLQSHPVVKAPEPVVVTVVAEAPEPAIEPSIEQPAIEPAPPAPPIEVQPEKTKPKPKVTPKVEKKAPVKPAPKPKVKPKPKPKPQPQPKKPAPKAQEKAKPDKAKQEKAAQEKLQREKAAKQKAAEQEAQIRQALSKLDAAGSLEKKKSQVSQSAKAVAVAGPSSISTLASESLVTIQSDEKESFSAGERTYYDELVRRLKLSLKLPEYGEVKLNLTIARAGAIVSVKNVKSKSKKNSDYIQKALPKLHMPPFGQNFGKDKEHTFHLTLSNELNY